MKKPEVKKKKVYTPPDKKIKMKDVFFVGKGTT